MKQEIKELKEKVKNNDKINDLKEENINMKDYNLKEIKELKEELKNVNKRNEKEIEELKKEINELMRQLFYLFYLLISIYFLHDQKYLFLFPNLLSLSLHFFL